HARGAQIRSRLESALAGHPGVAEIRGQGLMIGIELAQPCGVLVQRALNAGLLINVTSDRVIRLLPALIITAEEADDVVDRLLPLVQDFLRECA
ncbi:MAG TPA: aminotransferase class III-fold pyridoxal phosphate-dependent enzyme, partial [Burkholderiaceae bacterium]|nr:aminotransferase class III-fold pyridoxal phosphate-dependent enzyme [Burkholderiaceae bacterium]